MLFVSLIRGFVFYIAFFGAGAGLAWLILPWRYGISPGSPHMMMAMMGGGAVLALAVITALSLATFSN